MLNFGLNMIKNTKKALCPNFQKPKALAQKTILIIEDNVECQQVAQMMLRSELSCEVIVASNGREGLEYLRGHAKGVDLILLDIMMPEMTGLEFLSIAKRSPLLKNIPVILQTGGSSEDLQRGVELGAMGYVRKPYTREVLLSAIEQIKVREVV